MDKSPLSPQMRQHQELYLNTRMVSPQWKENFRKKCLLRARQSRAELVDRFRRGLCRTENCRRQQALSFMEREWGAHDPLHLKMMSDNTEEKQVLFEILHDIENEINSFEQQQLKDLENFEQQQTEDIVTRNQTKQVVCPVCQLALLHESGNSNVACQCGLLLSGASLLQVENNLDYIMKLHNQNCSNTLIFVKTPSLQTVSPDGVPNVLATCTQCDWMSFVL